MLILLFLYWWEKLIYKEIMSGAWDEVGGQKEGSRGREHVFLQPIHVDVWQKPAQRCRAIILWFNINELK